MSSRHQLCPKCKTPLVLTIESEYIGSERRITYKYRCNACNYKVVLERVILRKVNGYLRLEVVRRTETYH